MKVSKRSHAQATQKTRRTDKKEPAKETKVARRPAETFDAKAKTNHARVLDGDNATKAQPRHANLYGDSSEDRAAALGARVDAGALKRTAAPNVGTAKGVDLGPGGEYNSFALTERRAFEVGNKVFVLATVWETPGKVWFEVGRKPSVPEQKPDPAIALKARVDASTLVPLSKPPKNVGADGVWLGGGDFFHGNEISELRAFPTKGKLFVRATVWEKGPQWFEAKEKA